MRLIDADALKQEIHCWYSDDLEILDHIDKQSTIQPEPHWIPVTERLPEKGNTAYLATLDYGEYGMAVGQRFFFGDNIGWNDKSVVAWMPLPKPMRLENK